MLECRPAIRRYHNQPPTLSFSIRLILSSFICFSTLRDSFVVD